MTLRTPPGRKWLWTITSLMSGDVLWRERDGAKEDHGPESMGAFLAWAQKKIYQSSHHIGKPRCLADAVKGPGLWIPGG